MFAPRLVCLFLVLITLTAFWQVRECEFINFDDYAFVLENAHVRDGLTWSGVQWAFASHFVFGFTKADYWAPVAFLSHSLDFQIYGTNPAGHHLTNLVIHVLNVLLLFWVLLRMSKSLWPSAFVAVLFAIHPLNVESVVWIVERKGLLSAFFGFVTIWTYIHYTEHPNIKRYLLVVLAYQLSLMSKMTSVTLPFALLLLDWWPLGRGGEAGRWSMVDGRSSSDCGSQTVDHRRWTVDWGVVSPWLRLVLEKLPLFALSAASCVQSLLYMRHVGNLQSLETLPMTARISNALVAYVAYIGKMVWPVNLCIFYPYPVGSIPFWQVTGAGLVLAGITLAVFRLGARHSYLPVGWLWYLGNLVPLIGLVQAGEQAMADRYTYIPHIGLFFMLAWGGASVLQRFAWIAPKKRSFAAFVTILLPFILILCLIIFARLQIRHWRNSITLFERALKMKSDNVMAHYNLANALADEGKLDEAISHYVAALQINPFYFKVHNNFGNALLLRGHLCEAERQYRNALIFRPRHVEARYNLGVCLAKQGRTEEVVQCMKEVLKQQPDFVPAQRMLESLMRRSRSSEPPPPP